jgi:hypothetical protein
LSAPAAQAIELRFRDLWGASLPVARASAAQTARPAVRASGRAHYAALERLAEVRFGSSAYAMMTYHRIAFVITAV